MKNTWGRERILHLINKRQSCLPADEDSEFQDSSPQLIRKREQKHTENSRADKHSDGLFAFSVVSEPAVCN